MAEQTSSGPYDFVKMMGQFDPTKMMGDFTKLMGDYKLPGLDINALVESQRKNVEALTAANKKALEGMQTVAKRQSEILRQSMDEAAGALKDLATSGSPQDFAAKEAEMLKQTLQKALTHMRELAEMVTRSNTDAFDTINGRISDSIAEMKSMVTKLKQS